jgi:hypothetical protein
MIALIGYSGFVGSNLLKHLPISSTLCYNSKNIHNISNKVFDTVYCSGLYAEKWKVNLNPEPDIESIKKLQNYLSTIKCTKFILLSTIDVLNTDIIQDEDGDIYANHNYGKNRLLMEKWCLENFLNCYIIRLPALYGFGLKKNALYDLINNNNIEKIRSHWSFQWYNIEWLYNDIQTAIEKNIKIFHLISVSIDMKTINSLFFPHIHLKDDKDIIVDYKVTSKFIIKIKNDILDSMGIFIKNYKVSKNLLVSELSWLEKDEMYMRTYLKSYGIDSVESMPSRNFDYVYSVYSLQSLLYMQDIQIFKDQLAFKNIVNELCIKFHKLEVKIFIFGSPKQRIFNGEDSIKLFKEIGDICSQYNIMFCIENNSSKYQCNWLNKARDTIDFVKQLNHKNIGVNLDIGSMIMENEELNLLKDDIEYIKHVQISFPYLTNWDTRYEPYITQNINNILENGYKQKISLEVKYYKDICFNNIKLFTDLISKISL